MLDATFGRGGHSRAFLRAGACVVAMDRDPAAADCAARLRPEFPDRFSFRHLNFAGLAEVNAEIGPFDAILLDLGVSSPQLDDASRGFSFQNDGPLDMRMDPTRQQSTAADLVNQSSETELVEILFKYGEESAARRIARAIARERGIKPLERTMELAVLVEKVLGGRRDRKLHPATKTFQALRIAVNGELSELESVLAAVPGSLKPCGRVGVISFHALEDRMVKRFVEKHGSEEIRGDGYAFGAPNPDYCLRKVGRWLPSENEVRKNPRSRSARLRVAEKLP